MIRNKNILIKFYQNYAIINQKVKFKSKLIFNMLIINYLIIIFINYFKHIVYIVIVTKRKNVVILLLTMYDTDLADAENGNPNQNIDFNFTKVNIN